MTTMAASPNDRSLMRAPRVDRVEASRKQGSAGYLHEDDPTLRGWTPRAKVYRDPAKRASAIARLRTMAWMLDTSIALPLPFAKNFRIGLDPLLGLIPGIGDILGAMLSGFILRDAIRLGAPWGLVARMALNVLIELLVGTVPILGDLFDAAWKANVRNLRLMGVWKD